MPIARTLSWALVSTAIAASPAACGPTVLVEGETYGAGGGVPFPPSGTTSTPEPPMGCVASCSVLPNGKDACTCDYACDSYPGNAKAECEPNIDLQGNLKTKCICTLGDTFTGICFETHPEFLCDYLQGCCGKYLGK